MSDWNGFAEQRGETLGQLAPGTRGAIYAGILGMREIGQVRLLVTQHLIGMKRPCEIILCGKTRNERGASAVDGSNYIAREGGRGVAAGIGRRSTADSNWHTTTTVGPGLLCARPERANAHRRCPRLLDDLLRSSQRNLCTHETVISSTVLHACITCAGPGQAHGAPTRAAAETTAQKDGVHGGVQQRPGNEAMEG